MPGDNKMSLIVLGGVIIAEAGIAHISIHRYNKCAISRLRIKKKQQLHIAEHSTKVVPISSCHLQSQQVSQHNKPSI